MTSQPSPSRRRAPGAGARRCAPTGCLVVSSHWDREWYEPFQYYRSRLVDVIDALLDLMERDARFPYFQFDGQTVVLEDYLEIKPENRARLEALIRAGRIQVGPWYVQPDEFLPCGEALIRNLLRGHQLAAEFGGVMKVGFVCDTFGHNSQLPQLFRGCGIDTAAVWRGTNYPTHPGLFRWQAADGSEVLTYVFEDVGYGQYYFLVRMKSHTPAGKFDYAKALAGLRQVFEIEQPRVPGRALLLFDGLDHMPAEPATPELIRRARAAGLPVRHTTLAEYFAEVRRQNLKLKVFRGELRETAEKNGNVIPGVASSRIYLKQHNAACEHRLLHWLEPFAVLAQLAGCAYPRGYLRLAWKYLLRNHPHDSICGCSIDQVHQDMLYRFDQCRMIADRNLYFSLRALTDRMRLPQIKGDEDFTVTIFNPTDQPADGVLDFPLYFRADTKNRFSEWFGYEPIVGFRLYDADGREVEYQRLDVVKQANVKTYDRLAGFKETVSEQVRVAAQLSLPPRGWTTLLCKPTTEKTRSAGTQVLDDHQMQNDHLRVSIRPNGTIDLLHRKSGQTYTELLTFEDRADIGDGWYHGTAVNDEWFTSHGTQAEIALVHDGFALTTFRLRSALHVPARFEHDQKVMRRSSTLMPLVITSWLTLRAGAPYLEIRTEVENTVRDHRLRVLFPTGLGVKTYFADSAFDVVERPVALRPDWYKLHEPEVETKPQYSFTAVNDGQRGFAVLSSGQPESAVRDLPARPIALTLFRGFRRTVGTPGEDGGQMLGRTRHTYWLFPHAGPLPVAELLRLGQRLATGIECIYTDVVRQRLVAGQVPKQAVVLPATGSWLRCGPGPLIITACKASEDGQAVIVRAFNPLDEPARQRLEFIADVRAAHTTNLLEEPQQKLAVRGKAVTVTAAPKQIVTLRVVLAPLA